MRDKKIYEKLFSDSNIIQFLLKPEDSRQFQTLSNQKLIVKPNGLSESTFWIILSILIISSLDK